MWWKVFEAWSQAFSETSQLRITNRVRHLQKSTNRITGNHFIKIHSYKYLSVVPDFLGFVAPYFINIINIYSQLESLTVLGCALSNLSAMFSNCHFWLFLHCTALHYTMFCIVRADFNYGNLLPRLLGESSVQICSPCSHAPDRLAYWLPYSSTGATKEYRVSSEYAYTQYRHTFLFYSRPKYLVLEERHNIGLVLPCRKVNMLTVNNVSW